jgi:hypothetical protein
MNSLSILQNSSGQCSIRSASIYTAKQIEQKTQGNIHYLSAIRI